MPTHLKKSQSLLSSAIISLCFSKSMKIKFPKCEFSLIYAQKYNINFSALLLTGKVDNGDIITGTTQLDIACIADAFISVQIAQEFCKIILGTTTLKPIYECLEICSQICFALLRYEINMLCRQVRHILASRWQHARAKIVSVCFCSAYLNKCQLQH